MQDRRETTPGPSEFQDVVLLIVRDMKIRLRFPNIIQGCQRASIICLGLIFGKIGGVAQDSIPRKQSVRELEALASSGHGKFEVSLQHDGVTADALVAGAGVLCEPVSEGCQVCGQTVEPRLIVAVHRSLREVLYGVAYPSVEHLGHVEGAWVFDPHVRVGGFWFVKSTEVKRLAV